MKSRWTLPRGRHFTMVVTSVLVGVAYASLAFANGGYSTEVIAAVTIVEWWVVILALATRLWPGETVPKAAIVAGALLAGLGALTALSMIWANDAERAFTEVIRVCGYLGLFTLTVIASGKTGARPWLLGLAGGLFVVVLGSLASRFDPTLFGGGDRSLFAELPLSHGRLSYPVGYWNGLGACLALGVALFAWLGTEIRSAVGRAAVTAILPLFGLAIFLTSSRGGYLAAAVAALVLLFLLSRRVELIWTLLLTAIGTTVLSLMANARGDLLHGLSTPAAYSQGRVMALACVVCVLLVGLARYFGDRVLARTAALSRLSPRTLIAAPVVVVLVAVVVAILIIGPADAFNQFVDSKDIAGAGAGHLTSTTGSGRYQFWGAALDAFASKPVLGIGAGNYELWWNTHASIPVVTLDAHSLYLETLAELGVVGLILLLGFLGVVIVSAARRLAAKIPEDRTAAVVALALFAAALTSAALDWTWELPAAFAPAIVAAALLTGAATERAPAKERGPVSVEANGSRRRRRRPRAQFGIGIATILVAWIAIWAAGDQLVAAVKLDDSRNAVDRGQLDTAAQDARDAAAIQPWSPEPQLQLALIEKDEGNLAAASEAARKAVDAASDDWRPWLVAVEINAALGKPRVAQLALARANELSPRPLRVALASGG